MARFNSTITDTGAAVLARFVAAGEQLILHRAAAGNGIPGAHPEALSALVNPIAIDVQVGAKAFIEGAPSYMKVPVQVSNTGMIHNEYVREVAIYGLDEDENEFIFIYSWLNGSDSDNVLPATSFPGGEADTIHVHDVAVVVTNQGNAAITIDVSPGSTVTNAEMVAYAAALNHASRHASDGDDPLLPSDIGAAAEGHGHSLESLGAAAASDLSSAQTNITALQKAASTLFTTAGAAPAFTVADASVTAYVSGLRRTIQFHAAGTNATLNFNGLGAKALYEYTGKQMSVKAGQVVEVCYNGTYFFGVSLGGGVEFPATPTAGDVPLLLTLSYATLSSSLVTTTYANFGGTFTIKKAGVYRIKYGMKGDKIAPYYGYARLTKNGTAESGSEIASTGGSTTLKTIDITCSANDVIRFQGRCTDPDTRSAVIIDFVAISIASSDVQTAITELVV